MALHLRMQLGHGLPTRTSGASPSIRPRSSNHLAHTPRGQCNEKHAPAATHPHNSSTPSTPSQPPSPPPPAAGEGSTLSRRTLFLAAAFSAASAQLLLLGSGSGTAALAASAAPAAVINLALAPDQGTYDAADPTLREAAQLLQQGLNAADVAQEEAVWTQIIEKYGGLDAPWVPDVVGRAWGNRGNARSRQGRLEEALQDYNTAIQLCPWSADPVLNRGVVLEALGRWGEAVADYRAVLEVAPEDPAAWNNLGNATAGLGKWEEAAPYYQKAVQLAPEFSFASANFALAQYQLGKTNEAVKSFRSLLRKYPDFPDMRAALAAALWADGLEAQAESSWTRVDDPRYRDRQWLRTNRRWPPRLLAALEAFLDVKSLPK